MFEIRIIIIVITIIIKLNSIIDQVLHYKKQYRTHIIINFNSIEVTVINELLYEQHVH